MRQPRANQLFLHQTLGDLIRQGVDGLVGGLDRREPRQAQASVMIHLVAAIEEFAAGDPDAQTIARRQPLVIARGQLHEAIIGMRGRQLQRPVGRLLPVIFGGGVVQHDRRTAAHQPGRDRDAQQASKRAEKGAGPRQVAFHQATSREGPVRVSPLDSSSGSR